MISNCCADYPLRAKCLLGKPLQPEGERDPYAWLTAESSLKTLVKIVRGHRRFQSVNTLVQQVYLSQKLRND
jgi:hypothetical protein